MILGVKQNLQNPSNSLAPMVLQQYGHFVFGLGAKQHLQNPSNSLATVVLEPYRHFEHDSNNQAASTKPFKFNGAHGVSAIWAFQNVVWG